MAEKDNANQERGSQSFAYKEENRGNCQQQYQGHNQDVQSQQEGVGLPGLQREPEDSAEGAEEAYAAVNLHESRKWICHRVESAGPKWPGGC